MATLAEPFVVVWSLIEPSTASQPYVRANATVGDFYATVTETATLVVNLTAGTSSLVEEIVCGSQTNNNTNIFGTATTVVELRPGITTTMYETFCVAVSIVTD